MSSAQEQDPRDYSVRSPFVRKLQVCPTDEADGPSQVEFEETVWELLDSHIL